MEGRVNVATILTRLCRRPNATLAQQEIMLLARDRLADLTHLKISVEEVPRVGGGGFRAAPCSTTSAAPIWIELVEVSEAVAER